MYTLDAVIKRLEKLDDEEARLEAIYSAVRIAARCRDVIAVAKEWQDRAFEELLMSRGQGEW